MPIRLLDSTPHEWEPRPPRGDPEHDRRSTPKGRRRLGPLPLALILGLGYLAFGATYIIFSGRLAAELAPSLEGYQSLEIAKGLLFILLNGAALFALALIWRQRLEESRKDLVRETERARRFARYLDAMHDSMPVAVLVLLPEADGDFTVRRSNPAFRRLIGSEPGELGGRAVDCLRERFGERNFGEFHADLTRCTQEGERLEREIGGSEHADAPRLLVLYSPLVGEDGRVERVLVTFTDITELRRSEERLAALQEELLHSQRLMTIGELASGVAHDVNNMLTVIATHADLLERGLEDRPELKYSLEVISAAVEHASGVSRSMLEMGAKVAANQPVLDLGALTSEMIALLQRILPKRLSIELDSEVRQPLPVRADRIQIGQVLLNLALNARDAIEGVGHLTLRLELDGDEHVRLSVEDDGPGIPPELEERVFEPFFTTRGDRGGTGLGLPMARRIARAHGGDLLLERPPGGGLRAVLRMPLCREPEAAARAVPPDGRYQVLMAEQHPQVRAILSNELEEAGYPARSLETLDDLIELWEREHPLVSVVVLNGGVTGSREETEVLRRLRRAGIDQPVVLMTPGEVSSDLIHRFAPVLPLRKPFGVAEFTQRISEAANLAKPQTDPV